MERKLQERMVGAGVLVLLLVIVGPLLLDGGPQRDVDTEAIPGQRSDELRTQTIDLRSAAGGSPPAAAAPGPAAVPPPAPPPPAAAPAPTPAIVAPGAEPTPPVVTAPAVGTPAVPAQLPERPVEKPAAQSPAARAPEPARTAGPAPAAGERWVVQVGTFGQKNNAERLVAILKGRGFAAALGSTTSGGRALYRVRVGPAGSREAAAALAGRLAAAGHSGQVVPQ